MNTSERRRHEEQSEGYMMVCTDSQLFGVVETEKARIKRSGEGDVCEVARIMLRAAQAEIRRRGLE